MNSPEDTHIGPKRKEESVHSLRLKARKAKCQVEGCDEPLPRDKAYHKRYKICAFHASLPQMTLDGCHVRFRQQCGKFQPLSDFDTDRRSCRKKLQIHNSRRKQARSTATTSAAATAAPTESKEGILSHSKTSSGGSGGRKSEGAAKGDDFSDSEPLPLDDALDLDELLFRLESETSLQHPIMPPVPLDNPIAPLPPQPAPPVVPQNQSTSLESRNDGALANIPLTLPLPLSVANQLQGAASLLDSYEPASPAVEFTTPSDLVRVSFKLFNAHPSQLPATVFQELQNLMCSSAHLYINARIGCNYLTVDALLSPQQTVSTKSHGSRGLLNTAVARGSLLFPENTFEGPGGQVIAQIGNEASLLGANLDINVILAAKDANTSPILKNLVPFATLSGARCAFGLYGSNITDPQDVVVCRRGSGVANLEVIRSGCTASNGDYIEFVLPRPATGLHFVEVQRGSLLSATALPFMVLDSADAVQEIRQLEYNTAGIGDEQNTASFLRIVGVMLDWLKMKNTGSHTSSTASDTLGYTSYITNPLQFDSKSTEIIAPLAQRVAATCIVRGWPALLRLVLPAIVPLGTDPAVAIENFKRFSNKNLPLLHLAVLSRCPEVVNILAEWSQSLPIKYTWRCEAATIISSSTCAACFKNGTAAAGITPLHLAALIEDGGRMAAALTGLFLDQFDVWSSCGDDGAGTCAVTSEPGDNTTNVSAPRVLSAADFAVLVNNQPVCCFLKRNGVPLNYAIKQTLAAGICRDDASAAGSQEQDKSNDGSIGLMPRLRKSAKYTQDDSIDDLFNQMEKLSQLPKQRCSLASKIVIPQGAVLIFITLLALYLRFI